MAITPPSQCNIPFAGFPPPQPHSGYADAVDRETWNAARPLVLAGVVLIGLVLVLLLVTRVIEFMGLFFLGAVLGVALNPLVDTLSRVRIPRVASVLMVYAIVGVLIAIFSYLAFLEVSNDALNLEIEGLREDYESLREDTALPSSEDIEGYLTSLAEQAGSGLLGQAYSFIGALFSIFTILFIALLFTITQTRMRLTLLSLVPPMERRRTDEVMAQVAKGLRGFIRGQLIAMIAVGLITYIGLTVLGVRLALLLAFIAFMMEIVPLIGPWIAFIPALIVALTDGFWTAVQVSLLYLAIQSFESYVIGPLVLSRAGKVPALLILSSLLIGGSLLGVMGAIMALPMAVILHIIFFEVVIPWTEKRYKAPAPINEPEEWA